MSTQDGSIINGVPNIPLTEDANFIRYVESKQNGEQFFVLELRSERMQEHYQYLKTIPAFKAYFDYAVSVGFDLPETQIHHLANFSHGNLLFITLEPCPEFHDVFKRFAAVFEQTYTRFLDLQKAEAQARESQVQLALERVRARTMAMQRSEELPGAATILFQQVQSLGMSAFAAGYCIWDEDKQAITLWMSSEGILQPPFKAPTTEDELFIEMRKGHEEGKSFHVVEMGGKKLVAHYQYMRTLPVVGEIFDSIIEAGHPLPTFQIMHHAYFSKGFLLFITYEPVPDAHDIFKRFAKVFDLTYTRFNDLQKAEAQAREAQIELGLERVRARAMAMQKSGELSELVDTVFKELTKLDFALTWCIINIIDESSLSNTVWAANPDITKAPESYHMLFEDYPFHHAMMKGWKERQTKCVYILEGNEKKIYDDYLFSETEFKRTPEAAQAASRAMEKYVVSFSFSNFGGLQTVGDVPLSDANLDILSRFGKVFDLTYTRFNDLKQAEAQARESQIQLALERVRARTMAMQKSDELPETSYLLFQQVKELGETTVQNSIGIINEETGFVELSTTVQGHHLTHTLNVPIDDPYVMAKGVAAWREKRKSLKLEFEGQELKDYNEHRNSFFEKKVKFPEDKWIVNIIFFSKGWLSFSSNKNISDETFDLLKRFAAVFEQTYTRFNDLKQAEAQARESQIQLALERVRARTMAMQRSDELKNAAALLFQQVKSLGAPAYSCGYNIWEKGDKEFTSWMSTQDGSIINGVPNIPLTEDANFIRYVESKQKGEQFFVLELRGERMQEHYQYLKTIPAFKAFFDYALSVGFDMPETQIHHLANFSNGNLLFITMEPCPEFHDVFKRFAAVFEQTYTRFLDLQKAEARARESQIQLAMEKVRSRTMAMQTSTELTDVAGLLFEQVSALDIKTWTAGFNVWSEDNNSYVDYITSPQGGFIEPYTVYTDTSEALTDISNARKSGVEFDVQYVDGEKIKQLYLALTKLDEKQYEIMLKDGVRFPSHQYEHFVFGSKVSLMFITYEPVPEAHDIFKRLGKVFEQTYTRFLDLQKAEAQAREAQIEASLERVRSKTMAMH